MDTKHPPPDPTAMSCPTCGGPLLQKSRLRLLVVGVGLTALLGLSWIFPWFWAPGLVLALTGGYLIAWATLGKGHWCRNCKKYPLR